MLKQTKTVQFMMVIGLSIAAWIMPGAAVAQKAATLKPQDKLALGEAEVRQSLLLIDADENGKISKQEGTKFMEAEIDRLDKDKA
jgi:hypothetical protein